MIPLGLISIEPRFPMIAMRPPADSRHTTSIVRPFYPIPIPIAGCWNGEAGLRMVERSGPAQAKGLGSLTFGGQAEVALQVDVGQHLEDDVEALRRQCLEPFQITRLPVDDDLMRARGVARDEGLNLNGGSMQITGQAGACVARCQGVR